MLILFHIFLVRKTNKNAKSSYRRDYQINPFSAGTVFTRQILTSNDGPHTEIIKTSLWPYTHNIGFEEKKKELSETFISL